MPEVEALMRRAVAGPRFARLGAIAQDQVNSGGRRMRARLALASAACLGLDRLSAVPWAAACELLHNATLIHDDIQDNDTHRRGKPSLWAQHGVGQAINAGDLLLMLPCALLAELKTTDGVRWRMAHALTTSAERTVRGQSAEMDLLASPRVDWQDWAWAAEGKTGALLGLPVEGAALLAGLDGASAHQLAAPFSGIGVLYQMADDLLDLTTEKGHGGRAGDIREGRFTSLVATHLSLHPADAPEVFSLLGDPTLRNDDQVVTSLIARFIQGGATRVLRERIEREGAVVTQNPVLRAVPDLHHLAFELLDGFVRRPLSARGSA